MVLDNTMGVGTTCLGAKELNRKFIGIEKEVKYYELQLVVCSVSIATNEQGFVSVPEFEKQMLKIYL